MSRARAIKIEAVRTTAASQRLLSSSVPRRVIGRMAQEPTPELDDEA